ncbi:iron ABC transporter permease [Rhodoplanes sp. TEM]|uniref:Iron ABC transporter permease n=1 Tax=Rhodoplanes tepidamans TaxID=200616 RepID=A0ABT5JF27_RHOTP|nr:MULTISPECIES: iron ABC transporter permease [Rhodoplanes]MDC7788231.1 iron ABC transporter permease [Rhodoplanes tepidamans]MDC7982964.1 iron ABC transporter permease [Rhodoplanes sp. TEM]MDQ0355901.1 iron(III) transport system permease protein [Rhodoplanes tepidamans]
MIAGRGRRSASFALRRLRPRHPLAWGLLVAVAALVLTPVASLVAIGSRGDPELWPHLAAYVLPDAVATTLMLLAGVAALTTLIGVGTAWLVAVHDFPGRGLVTWLLPLPLAFPTYIVAYVYADTLDTLGPVQGALRGLLGITVPAGSLLPEVRSLGGAVVVMSLVLYPYVYLAMRAMLQARSAALTEAARLLGAGGFRIARAITLPMARPALAAGLALVLMETLNDIGATEYLGVRTLTLAVFTTWLNRGSLAGAAQIACVMLVAVAALIALERHARRGRSVAASSADSRACRRVPLAGRAGALALLACLVPVGLGFAVPFVFLLREVFTRGLLVGFDPDLVRHAGSTVMLAGGATVLTLALGFGVAFAARLIRRRRAGALLGAAGLGYAVPGTVLALGLLGPLVAVDEAIGSVVRALTGHGAGLLLAGSAAAVTIAYTIRFLAIATGFAQAALARLPVDLDDAAASVGARPRRVVAAVHLPLVRPALLGAALLVFVDCLKELPATLLLRPLNTETLATYVYQFATRGSFEEGALAALLIVLVGLVPVIRMVRLSDDLDPDAPLA